MKGLGLIETNFLWIPVNYGIPGISPQFDTTTYADGSCLSK